MNLEEIKEKDSKFTEYEKEGFHLWNQYNTKPEMKVAVRNLKRWDSYVRVIRYPNGVYVVMYKEIGGRAK